MNTLGIPQKESLNGLSADDKRDPRKSAAPSPGSCPFRDGTFGSKTPYMPPGLQKTNTNSKKCKIRA